MRLLTYNIRFGGVGRDGPSPGGERCAPDSWSSRRRAARTWSRSSPRPPACRLGRDAGPFARLHEPLPGRPSEWHRPPSSGTPSSRSCPRASLRVFGVHLSAVHSAWTERRRVRELRPCWRGSRGTRTVSTCWRRLQHGRAGGDPGHRELPPACRPWVWMTGRRSDGRRSRSCSTPPYVDATARCTRRSPVPRFPTWDPHVRLDYFFVPQGARQALAVQGRQGRPAPPGPRTTCP